MPNGTIQLVSPANLKPHPLLALTWEWADGDERFHALCHSIGQRGMTYPILVDAHQRILDGRHRWRAAKAIGLAQVPVLLKGDADVAGVILEIAQRRHLTKSQMAYLASHPELYGRALEEAAERKHKQIAQGLMVGNGGKTTEAMACDFGLSGRMLRQARELRGLFAAHPEARTLTDDEGNTERGVSFQAFFEKRIFREDRPYSLGGVLAGLKATLEMEKRGSHGGGRPVGDPPRQLMLFTEIFANESKRWEYWQKFSEEEKTEHRAALRAQIAELSPDECNQRADYHAWLAGELRKGARAARE